MSRTTRHLAIVGVVFTGLLASADADAQSRCWARAYSADHMSAHQDQLVEFLQFDMGLAAERGRSTDPDRFRGNLTAVLRRPVTAYEIRLFETEFFCQAASDRIWACEMNCLRGSFTVTEQPGGRSALLTNSGDGINLYPCIPHDTFAGFVLPNDADHREFRLHACDDGAAGRGPE